MSRNNVFVCLRKHFSVKHRHNLAKGETCIFHILLKTVNRNSQSSHQQNPALPVEVGVARNVPETISPRLEEEFPLDFLRLQKDPINTRHPGTETGEDLGSRYEKFPHEKSHGKGVFTHIPTPRKPWCADVSPHTLYNIPLCPSDFILSLIFSIGEIRENLCKNR